MIKTILSKPLCVLFHPHDVLLSSTFSIHWYIFCQRASNAARTLDQTISRPEEERNTEKGSAQQPPLKRQQRLATVNTGAVSKALQGKLLRDRVEHIWTFPSALWYHLEVNWTVHFPGSFPFHHWSFCYEKLDGHSSLYRHTYMWIKNKTKHN